MNQEEERQAADRVMEEVKAQEAEAAMNSEQKGMFNRVLNAVENFEEELKLEHDGCASDAWGHVKKVLYKVARVAVFSTRKGLEYLLRFLKICRKWIKKADLAARMKSAWEGLTRRHKDDIPAIQN